MLSAPSFDANEFVKGVSGPDYRALMQYDHKPLLNKALDATYPPGSTSRPWSPWRRWRWGSIRNEPMSAINTGFLGATWSCDKVHGVQDMRSAIATSCDIFFYQTALVVGPDRIAATARKFGLGDTFDIGTDPQKRGLVPDTAYKRKHFPHDPIWHPGETPSMGIGQGYTNINPLQLCVQAARLANGVKAIQPRLIHSIGGVVQPTNAAPPDLPFAKEHLDFVREAMAAVTGASGAKVAQATGAALGDLGLGPVKMAGKTGTAQSHNYGRRHPRRPRGGRRMGAARSCMVHGLRAL